LASICRKDKVIKQCEREERWFKACDCAERLFSTVRATWTTSGPRKSRSRKVKKRLKFFFKHPTWEQSKLSLKAGV
jgi:hypothetical protein